MIVKYTYQEMMDAWRAMTGLEPAMADASVERFDGFEMERRLAVEMRAWYLNYLRTAPLERVPISDLIDHVSVFPGPGHDWWTVTWDRPTARIVDLALEGTGPVPIVTDPDALKESAPLQRLRNRMWRRGCQPVAFHRTGSDRLIVNAASATTPLVSQLTGVVTDHDDGCYYVDEQELANIPNYLNLNSL